MILRGEETLEMRRRDVLLDGLRIQSIAGNRYRVIVDVGCEDLQLYVSLRGRDRLEEEHGDRVGFLARAASGVPDPDRLVQRLPAYQLGNDLLRQDRERLFIAEKSGDVDQHGFGEEIDLIRILADRVQIDTDVLDRRHRHPPFDLAQERALLVEGEIVRGARAQEVDDHVQPGIGAVAQRWFCALWFGVRLAAEFDRADGISATGSTRSAAPVMIALRGIPSWAASFGSCTMTSPPLSCIAISPRLPSVALPDRTAQTARSPQSAASERRKKSKGMRAPCRSRGCVSRNAPSRIER